MPLESAPQGVVAGSIPLFAGHPAPELLPMRAMQRIVAGWRGNPPIRAFNYGDEQGDPQLLDFLHGWLNATESLGIRRDNLMIVPGSTGGVAMLTRLLTAPGDCVLVDAPSYRDALHIFRDQGLDIRALPIDDEGIRLDALDTALRKLKSSGIQPRFYYVVPNFQNPSGITISESRRRAVVALSREYRFLIVEDDVYSSLRFSGAAPPSFYALAGGEGVLRLGSFSKTLAPGVRLGWLVGAAEAVASFVDSGVLRMGGGANPYSAAVVAEFCASGGVGAACGLAARAIPGAAGCGAGGAGRVDAARRAVDSSRRRLLSSGCSCRRVWMWMNWNRWRKQRAYTSPAGAAFSRSLPMARAICGCLSVTCRRRICAKASAYWGG